MVEAKPISYYSRKWKVTNMFKLSYFNEAWRYFRKDGIDKCIDYMVSPQLYLNPPKLEAWKVAKGFPRIRNEKELTQQ